MKRVMLFGTFDVLHLGHINLFTQAKVLGDELVVVVSCDGRVQEVKGKGPVHTQEERMTLLAHIDLVDRVIPGDEADVYAVIKREQPDVIALGYDQVHFVERLAEKLQAFGLQTQIVRLEPHKITQHKSNKIKTAILDQL